MCQAGQQCLKLVKVLLLRCFMVTNMNRRRKCFQISRNLHWQYRSISSGEWLPDYQSPHFGVQTFLPQQEGVEGHMVDAEVEESLSRHPALPAAAGVVRHQFLWRGEAKVQLELQQRLSELFWVVLLGGLATPKLLCNKALHRRKLTLITSEHFTQTRYKDLCFHHHPTIRGGYFTLIRQMP